jgi:hypothetical protein
MLASPLKTDATVDCLTKAPRIVPVLKQCTTAFNKARLKLMHKSNAASATNKPALISMLLQTYLTSRPLLWKPFETST